MSMFEEIYRWGAVLFFLIGLVYGLSGIGSIPFVGRSKYSDSVLGRIAIGLGIWVVWPLFIPYYLLTKGKK